MEHKTHMPGYSENVLLSDYTTFRIGGPARFFCAPETEEQLIKALDESMLFEGKKFVLGNGSNVLFPDEGFDGLVIYTGKCSQLSLHDQMIHAQCGASLPSLSAFALRHGLEGLVFASGIPGSVGGAVYMNAGAYGGEIGQVIGQVATWKNGKYHVYTKDQLTFEYRHTSFMGSGEIILSADFALFPGDIEEMTERTRDLSARRREKQPLQYPSAGSFFKRPAGSFAGKLIDEAGLKGTRVGDAQVSTLHAGFIINLGNASARDVIGLMKLIQSKVFEQTGIRLENEVELVGFSDEFLK